MKMGRRKLCLLLMALCAQTILAASINQNVNQKVKDRAGGAVNQVISQDVDKSKHSSLHNQINQNINQDISGSAGHADSINQNIHQKVNQGSTCIDEKTSRVIKNHDKRSSDLSCSKEFIFKKHRNQGGCGCGIRDSSEEIEIRDQKHSSEIVYKTHEDRCGDVSEEQSEEIRIKYRDECGKCKKKSCECNQPKSSEEIVIYKHSPQFVRCQKSCEDDHFESKPWLSSEEIIIKNKPCDLKSSEELDIKTWIKPCENRKLYDISSEEIKHTKPCECQKCLRISEEESSEEKCKEKQRDCKKSSEEKPCGCKKCHQKSKCFDVSEEKSNEENCDEKKKCVHEVESSEEKPCECKKCQERNSEEKPCRRESSEEKSPNCRHHFEHSFEVKQPNCDKHFKESSEEKCSWRNPIRTCHGNINCGCKKQIPNSGEIVVSSWLRPKEIPKTPFIPIPISKVHFLERDVRTLPGHQISACPLCQQNPCKCQRF